MNTVQAVIAIIAALVVVVGSQTTLLVAMIRGIESRMDRLEGRMDSLHDRILDTLLARSGGDRPEQS